MRAAIRTVIVQWFFVAVIAASQVVSVRAEQSVTFDTRPVTSARAGAVYIYDAGARTIDGSAVQYSLQHGPAGMTVDARTGAVRWTPASAGNYSIGIRGEMVNDPAKSTVQEWSVEVVASMQTGIAIDPLSFSMMCRGESISVGYTATGSFVAGNVFILQLSDKDGSFDEGFRNLASVSSTASGTITAMIPKDVSAGDGYRLRVISSNPVFIGSDNGSDLAVEIPPVATIVVDDGSSYGYGIIGNETMLLGNSISFIADSNMFITDTLSYAWDFGDDASPATSNVRDPGSVTYSALGRKTVTLTVTSAGGCSSETKLYVDVISNTISIPADAIVIQGDSAFHWDSRVPHGAFIWVCPGGILRIDAAAGSAAVICVEAGGAVSMVGTGYFEKVYMKAGASLSSGVEWGNGLVVCEEGAGITGNSGVLSKVVASPVVFDYTDAPVGGCPSLAPYQKRIPDDVLMVRGAQTSGESQKEFWVRNGGVLEAAGDGNTYIADAGARVVATGNSATVYLKNGSSFEARGGSGHRIFYEPDAVIADAGAESGLFPGSELTYLYQGKVTGVRNEEALMESRDLEVLPNPAGEVVTVRHERTGSVIRRLEVHDAVGRLVREEPVMLHQGESGSLSLAGLVPGVYYVRASGEGVVLVKKVIVQ